MVRTYPGWSVLNKLGRQYYEETQKGHGIGEDKESRLGNRSDLQIRLVNNIVDGSLGLIKMTGIRLLSNNRFFMPNAHSISGYVPLSLNGLYQTVEIGDLIAYGSIGVIESMHNFDPNKGAISTFISYTAVGKMYREASRDRTLILIPSHVYDRALKIMRTSKSKKEALDRFQFEDAKTFVKMTIARANLLYELIIGEYVDIDKRLSAKDDSPSTQKWADKYLIDIITPSAEDVVSFNDLAETTRKVLCSLTPREEKIIRLKFGVGEITDHTLEEVAQDFNVTRERVRQIEAKALRKLRHPSRCKLLKAIYKE